MRSGPLPSLILFVFLQVTSAVLSYGVAELGREEQLWEKLESTSYPHNQEYYRSLSATKNPETAKRLLEGLFILSVKFSFYCHNSDNQRMYGTQCYIFND